jgi:hypothetical protein
MRIHSRPKAASEFPDAGSNHLFIERVDRVARRFVHLGRVEVVGLVPGLIDLSSTALKDAKFLDNWN